jgi:hypothetical protein
LIGGNSGADADVEHLAPGAPGKDQLDHGVGIARTGAVVALGVRAE